MITAVDTNVLLDILVPNEQFVDASVERLEEAKAAGSVVICDMVYVELCTHFDSQRECDLFLTDSEIRVDSISREASFLASRAWLVYRKQGGQRSKILPDFLIGAHAQVQASRLLSRDRGFYRKLFPGLKLIDPAI